MSVRKIVEQKGDQSQFPKSSGYVTISYKSWVYEASEAANHFRGRPVGTPMNDVNVRLGSGILLASCEKEILKMSVGERAFLIVPENLAYGAQGIPNLVPPKTDVVISIQLMGIK